MSEPAPLASPQAALRDFDQRTWRSAVMLNVLILAASYSPTPAFVQAVALNAVAIPTNIALDVWLRPRTGIALAERARTALNTGAMLGLGYILGWPLALWMWLPFSVLLTDTKRVPGAYVNLVVQAAVFDAAALLAGVPPIFPVCFTAFALICYLLAQARLASLENVLEAQEAQNRRLQEAHHELEAMHHRALMQEKLSSLGMLAAGIAHEINNPMSYVTSNIKALADDLPSLPASPGLVEEYRTDILPATLDGLRRINAIVADLRRFARGDPESRMVEYDLNEELRAAARIAHSRFAHESQLRLELGTLPGMLGRPRQMTQVFVNLLVNAADAIGEQGTVTVSTELVDGQVRVRVSDTGIGMSEQTLKHLFQPFFTTKPTGEGMGLGLAVAHGIIQSHGGSISVDSKPGVGTCFTLVLPPVPSPGPARAPGSGGALLPGEGG
jgi:signal transduction histidine kinase